jgi:hypothetical protein
MLCGWYSVGAANRGDALAHLPGKGRGVEENVGEVKENVIKLG